MLQSKNDSYGIERFCGDAFFKQALVIGLLPFNLTLRQRTDARACVSFAFMPTMTNALLAGQRPDYGVLAFGRVPLDVDTFAMDNGDTANEGVERTYAGVVGVSPLAAFLGQHAFCMALRLSAQHSASKTGFNLERVITMAKR